MAETSTLVDQPLDADTAIEVQNNSLPYTMSHSMFGEISSSLEGIKKAVVEISSSVKIITPNTSVQPNLTIPIPSSKQESFDSTLDCIAEARYCNMEDFKNSFNETKDRNVLDVLLGDSTFLQQCEQEMWKRGESSSPARYRGLYKRLSVGTVPCKVFPGTFTEKRLNFHGLSGQHEWVHRIRINSRRILRVLASLCPSEHNWDEKQCVFNRPFLLLIHYHDRMKEELNKIKSNIISDTPNSEIGDGDMISLRISSEVYPHTTEADRAPSEREHQERQRGPDDPESLITLKHMQCYIDFMEDKILPSYRQYEDPTDTKAQNIRLMDIPYLFRVGELIYVPKNNSTKIPKGTTKAEPQRVPSTQTIRKVYGVLMHDLTETYVTDCGHQQCDGSFIPSIACYYIDHDGERYGSRVEMLKIEPFEGEKKVTELPFYPIRFMPHYEEARKEFMEDGKRFVEHLERQYSFYSGWSLTKDPIGGDIKDANGAVIKSPEHVDSDVLVDFAETFNNIPEWKPLLVELNNTFKYETPIIETYIDPSHFIMWSDRERTTKLGSWSETTLQNDGMEDFETERFLKTDQFLSKKHNQKWEQKSPSGEDLMLLPRRMFAYAVWNRKFVQIDSRHLLHTSYHKKDKAFTELQIEPEYRKFIQALLRTHFEKESLGFDIGTQDLIHGKGRGVVILLHGAPGVGKTATAEAVAQHWEKPLFPITCGDLGFTPEKVESSLKEIFRLAHIWKCVLLLDEADVFIAQRRENDLQRNALVSVFLRQLEYYNGVLFLTTNRVGVVDEAIKSRVHLTLEYKPLDEEKTLAIFSHNIERLKRMESLRHETKDQLAINEKQILDFARNHFKDRKKERSIGAWNGRQIRNAFLIAASLAHYEGLENREKQPDCVIELSASHFNSVAKTMTKYDRYRRAVLRRDDAGLAAEREERQDNFITRDEQRNQREQRSRLTSERYSSYEDRDYVTNSGSTQTRGQVKAQQRERGTRDYDHLSQRGGSPRGYGRVSQREKSPREYDHVSQRARSPHDYHRASQRERSPGEYDRYSGPSSYEQTSRSRRNRSTSRERRHDLRNYRQHDRDRRSDRDMHLYERDSAWQDQTEEDSDHKYND